MEAQQTVSGCIRVNISNLFSPNLFTEYDLLGPFISSVLRQFGEILSEMSEYLDDGLG